MATPRISALMPSTPNPKIQDTTRTKSLGPHETSLLDLAMLLRKKKLSDELTLSAKALEALHHGATDDELQSVYDSALRAGMKDKKARRLTALSKALDAHRGYALPETRVVKLDDHETLLRDTGGKGAPMVLLHALSMDGSMWRDVYPRLAAQGRVVMYDIRGFGFAENAPKTVSMEQLADDLAAVLDCLQVSTADVYGTSYGGAIAQVFALRYPQRARSIAVLASVTQGFPILYERANLAEKFGMEYMVASTIRRWFLEDSVASNTWAVRYARTCVRRAKVKNWADAWRTMADFNVTDRLGELKIPVLAVGGVQDVSTPPALVKNVANLPTEGQYVEIDPGSHMMVMEQAQELVKVLSKFRGEVDSVMPKSSVS